MIKYFLDKPALPEIDLRLERKTDGASGYDLMANIGMPRTIGANRRWFCPTGLFLHMPKGVEAQVRSRSGLCRDHGVYVLNAPGTVDSDYRGEICVTLHNVGDVGYEVLPGDRIAQLVFAPVFAPLSVTSVGNISLRIADYYQYAPEHELVRAEFRHELELSARGTSGHGSTGR